MKPDVVTVAILMIPLVAAFVLGLLYGPAVQALDTGNELMTASDHVFQTDSFSLVGSLGSLIPADDQAAHEPDVVTGVWGLDVQSGNVIEFLADMSMINADGTGYTTIQLSNMTSDGVILYPNGIARANGTIDVIVNGTEVTEGVDVSISVAKLKAITIVVDSQNATGIFAGSPLYGIAQQPELESASTYSIMPETGIGLDNVTEKLSLPELPNPFQ